MRTIDADANIETMKKCAANPESKQALLCYRFAQRILEGAPTVEPASPWHRVEEELPTVGELVLCYFSRSKLYEALALLLVTEEGDLVWQDGTHCFNFSNGVTHWMPIEPPKE